MAFDRITGSSIEHLVGAFYGKIRQDPELGPVFIAAIGQRWDAHLARMCGFWMSAMRISTGYRGDMLAAHRRLNLSPALFARWLALFDETLAACFDEAPAAALRDRARKTAFNLQAALSHGAGAGIGWRGWHGSEMSSGGDAGRNGWR